MVHKFSMNGYNIVLDVNSGAVHVVDCAVYDVLDYFLDCTDKEITSKLSDRYESGVVLEALEEIRELERLGLLFSGDVGDYAKELKLKNPVVKALCLLVAQDCNLKCKYCFAGEGEYNNTGGRSLMSAETGKKAVDFLLNNSGSRQSLEVDFFGGEPLLNFDVVKDIVGYAREKEKEYGKNIRFTITTNGVLLDDEKLEYINREMKNIVLSIDGRKEVNDNMRKKAGGQGTYDTIVPIFQKTAESRGQTDYYVRGTFTRENMDFAEDVLHLADIGFKQISVEPVVGDKELPYTLKQEDLPVLFEEYERLAREIIKREGEGRGFNFFHFMIDLEGGPCLAKRLVGCGAGTEYLAVTTDGELYPCHQFTGNPEFKMGTLEQGVSNIELRGKFSGCHVYAKEKCGDCFAKFYCSGGCAANAYSENGDIMIPYEIGCELQKKRVECALMIKAVLSERESERDN